LELKTEVSDLIPGADANQPAVARTSAETSITAWNDRYLIWAAAASPAETATLDQGTESLYVMVKPVIQANGFAASPAGTPPTAPSPRQVVLDVRTVTLKQGDLLNVRVEWSWPKIQAGVFGNPGGPPPNAVTADGWPQGVQIGYTPDRTFTDALLAALDLLRKNNQATISTQQILVQEDCKAQIKALTEEWLPATAPTAASAATPYKIETGTILTVTPRIGDSNIMTLQISVESSDRVPMARGGSALPVITRRTTKNTVTLKDGGTVALAGVTTRPADPNDRTRYETAIFVTAHRVSDSVVIPPTRPSTETTVPATPTITATFAAADLLTVLKQIAECTDVKITPDLTVQTMPVTTELVEATPETALQQILKNTPYTSRKSDDGTYLVFRPLSFTFPDVNLVQALRDLSAAAEVPIIPDPDVTGTASSRLENVSLDEALQMLLAGKPYVFQRMPHYYLVAGPDIRSFRDDFPIETRRIRLHYTRPSRAKELLSPVFAPYVQVEPSRTRDPNDEGNTLLITAPPAVLDRIVADFKEIDRPRRQVFLDARIVVIKPNEIQRLPVEWDGPKVASAAFTDPANPNTATLSNNWPGGVRTGRTPDRVSTDSLMMALNQLQENGRADIIANPKVVALDGRQAQMKVIQEEWFMRTHPTIANSFPMREELQKVQSATVLTIIPHIRDDNDITLQVAMEVSDSIPKARGGSDRPLVTRRLAKDSVTVKDGGTVAVSGLTENRSKSSEKCVPGLSELRLIGKLFQNKNSDKPGREVVVFVTAHLIPEGSTHL
jgi:type II secretory pathway component GspD/PulD (secretin)